MSSIGTDEESEKWLDFDENISLPPQSIEEILADHNDFLDEEFGGFDDDGSSASHFGRNSHFAASVGYQLINPILLRKLESISHQFTCVRDRPTGGFPSALAVSLTLVAIGMTRGLVLIFERRTGKLVQFIHPDKGCGSVAALDFSPNATRLAIGFSRGALVISGCGVAKKIVQRHDEAVQPGRGILHVKYATSSALLVVDSGGSVFEVHEKAKKRRNSKCIFTGSKGEVVNICVIPFDELILLASLKQVLVLSIRRGAMVAQWPLVGDGLAPPLIDFRHRVVQVTPRNSVTDTRICVARCRELRVYQLQYTSNMGNKMSFPLLKVVRLDEPMVNLKWLDDFHILALSAAENCELVDASTRTAQKSKDSGEASLATCSFAHVNLVYNSADFKGLATGGNISSAMERLAESVCYQCVARHADDSTAFLLGQNGIYAVSLLDQVAQLDEFVERGDLASALLFIADVYGGLVRDKTAAGDLRSRISSKVSDLIVRFLDETVQECPEKVQTADLVEYFKRNVTVLQRVCVATSHFQLLYERVYRRLETDATARIVFLELLDEYVNEGQLDGAPAALIDDYLCHLAAEGHYSQFELAVTRFPVDRLDLHRVITVSRQNQLFDGIIYIMNGALQDYVTPLEEMFANLRRFVDKEVLSDWEIVQGNKLLLYLNCCLSGRAYPYGDLPADHLTDVVSLEAYKFLIQIRPSETLAADLSRFGGGGDATAVNGCLNNADGDATSFPHLRLVLKFDATQFLNVISTCVDASIFANSNGRLKRLVDILVGIVVTPSSPLSSSTDGGGGAARNDELDVLLVPFVLTLLEKRAIPEDVHLFMQLVWHIMSAPRKRRRSSCHHRRWQKEAADAAVVDLLRAVPAIDRRAVLDLALRRPHIEICTFILTERREYARLLEVCLDASALKMPKYRDIDDVNSQDNCADGDDVMNEDDDDDDRRGSIFAVTRQLLCTLGDDADALSEVRQFARSSVARLNAIDPRATADLLLDENFGGDYFSGDDNHLRTVPLELLRACFDVGREKGLRSITDDEDLDEQLFTMLFERSVEEAKAVDDPTAMDALDVRLSDSLRYWTPLGTRTDACLNAASANHLLECEIELLAARGFYARAFDVLMDRLCDAAATTSADVEDVENVRQKMNRISHLVSMILRLADAQPSAAVDGQWLTQLFRFLLIHHPADEEEKPPEAEEEEEFASSASLSMSTLLFDVLARLMESGALATTIEAAVLDELFTHTAFCRARLGGRFRRLFDKCFRSVFRTCRLDEFLHENTLGCVKWESAKGVVCRRRFFAASAVDGGVTEADEPCCTKCGRPIFKSFLLHRCGHATHLECAEDDFAVRRCHHCEPLPVSAARSVSSSSNNNDNESLHRSASGVSLTTAVGEPPSSRQNPHEHPRYNQTSPPPVGVAVTKRSHQHHHHRNPVTRRHHALDILELADPARLRLGPRHLATTAKMSHSGSNASTVGQVMAAAMTADYLHINNNNNPFL